MSEINSRLSFIDNNREWETKYTKLMHDYSNLESRIRKLESDKY